MKAYIAEDGSARLFRPDKNMERMNVSSKRLGLPGYDAKEGEKLIAELVNLVSCVSCVRSWGVGWCCMTAFVSGCGLCSDVVAVLSLREWDGGERIVRV